MSAHVHRRLPSVLLLLFAIGLGCSDLENGEDTIVARQIRSPQEHEEPLDPRLPLRAVSLRALQRVLAECVPKRACSEEILFFGRLTRILGYSLDPQGSDVLIYGLADSNLPRIHVDDFVVALRNSWLKYAALKGNTYLYTFPGCDIRPEPALVQRLQEVASRLDSSRTPGEIEAVLRSWRETCALPQDVSVLGVPFDTHFGHVLVTADYDMKRLADGSDHLDLPGLASVMDLEFHAAEASLRQGNPVTLKAGMNRFWLTPGDQIYDVAEGILWIRSSPVRIQTRPIGADAAGQLADMTGSDPAAEEFATRFSRLYDKVAEQRPIYRELQSLFQLFAVTQAMRFRNAPEQVGLNLMYLLESYPLSRSSVPRTVPGRHVVKHLQHESAVPGGTRIAQLWMPSCGGVEMRIEPEESHFWSDHTGILNRLKDRVNSARTSAPAWNVSLRDSENLAPITPLIRHQEMNLPGSPLVVTVEDRGSHYYAFTGGLEYRGLSVENLVVEADQLARQQGAETIYFELEGFTDDKAEAFTRDGWLSLKRARPESGIVMLRDFAGTTMEKILFTRGMTRAGETKPAERITTGTHKGLYQATATFLVWVKGVLHTITITVLGTSAEVVDAFMTRMNLQFRLLDSVPLSPAELSDRTRRQIEKEYGERVRIMIEEAGHSHWVHLRRSKREEAA